HALESGQLEAVAVTDHNTIEFALKSKQQLGDALIVGEEISTTDGDIIGLYLKEKVASGLSARQAASAIREQGGLVYVPHPFERTRKRLNKKTLDQITNQIDIGEVFNGRALGWSKKAVRWAVRHGKAAAASSDAHGAQGWG